ncbi:hypothetical protein ACFU99_11845 [Streptomyces sp. NPDC057654]|uniref:hypothetical protein n=1 Tax=Streptomyces sp. NPDC057654 TaxID=3346196 RepID=UPI003688B3D8
MVAAAVAAGVLCAVAIPLACLADLLLAAAQGIRLGCARRPRPHPMDRLRALEAAGLMPPTRQPPPPLASLLDGALPPGLLSLPLCPPRRSSPGALPSG